MLRRFRSIDEARRRFDDYVVVEPRLASLWSMCRRAAPPAIAANDEQVDDPFDVDAFENDVVASDEPAWCAEDWFLTTVKKSFVSLVGWHRTEDEPAELRGSNAYDDVYSALFCHALVRTCACCRDLEVSRRRRA